MDSKKVRRELLRSNWKLRLAYYSNIKHQAQRLWWKVRRTSKGPREEGK